jgi:hypothetical protein
MTQKGQTIKTMPKKWPTEPKIMPKCSKSLMIDQKWPKTYTKRRPKRSKTGQRSLKGQIGHKLEVV